MTLQERIAWCWMMRENAASYDERCWYDHEFLGLGGHDLPVSNGKNRQANLLGLSDRATLLMLEDYEKQRA